MTKSPSCHPSKKYYAKGLCSKCYHKTVDNSLEAVQLRRDRVLKSRYGISRAEWNSMWVNQKMRCKICNKLPKSDRATHTDHSHKTGKVRGILCSRCNHIVGVLESPAFLLVKAFKYILEED